MNLEEMKKESLIMQGFLEVEQSENPIEALERGNRLVVYLARTSFMLAEAKHLYSCKINSDLMKQLNRQLEEVPNLTSKAINLIVESIAKDEKYLVNLLDRMNATITHSLDWQRTLISKSKNEQYQNKSFN